MSAEQPLQHHDVFSNPHGKESLARVTAYLRNGHVGKARRLLEKKAWEAFSAALGSTRVDTSLNAAVRILEAVMKHTDLKYRKKQRDQIRERKNHVKGMLEAWDKEQKSLKGEQVLRGVKETSTPE